MLNILLMCYYGTCTICTVTGQKRETPHQLFDNGGRPRLYIAPNTVFLLEQRRSKACSWCVCVCVYVCVCLCVCVCNACGHRSGCTTSPLTLLILLSFHSAMNTDLSHTHTHTHTHTHRQLMKPAGLTYALRKISNVGIYQKTLKSNVNCVSRQMSPEVLSLWLKDLAWINDTLRQPENRIRWNNRCNLDSVGARRSVCHREAVTHWPGCGTEPILLSGTSYECSLGGDRISAGYSDLSNTCTAWALKSLCVCQSVTYIMTHLFGHFFIPWLLAWDWPEQN